MSNQSGPDAGIQLRLEQTMLALLAQRDPGATICPSEVARALGGDTWRDLMEPARAAARHLMAAGSVEITQGGKVAGPYATGPIRIRRIGDRRNQAEQP